ncbi:MAG: hypothetical protein ACJ73J_10665 [Actinomycetes bacterium]
MGSGLIYAAIAIMWAAVLIPMWLRNHDTATENRSAERYGQAMRVLSRKDGGPVHDEEASDEGELASRPIRPPARRVARAASAAKARRQQRPTRAPLTLIQRRARTLGALAGLTFVTVLLAAVTPLPWWAAAPFVMLTLAFVVHLRIQARQRVQRHRATGARSSAARSRSTIAVNAPEGQDADVRERRPRSEAEQRESRDESGVVQGPSRAVVVERKGDLSTAASAEHAENAGPNDDTDDEAWRPNPLPLPTYVTAPKAVRPIKVIDLTTPGAWSSGRLFDDDMADEDLLAAQVAEDELDALLDQEIAPPADDDGDGSRRAVGD